MLWRMESAPPLLQNIISLLPPSVPKSEDHNPVTAIQEVFEVISEEELQKVAHTQLRTWLDCDDKARSCLL